MAQQLYQERTGATGIQMPGQVSVPAMPVDTRGAALLGAVAGAGEKIGSILARDYARDQMTRIQESLLAARKEFAEWQAQYVQTRQGSNALTAEADFSAKMREIADRQLEAFGGNANEVFQRQLGGQMAALTLRAQEQGAAYASGQRSRWESSVLEGQRAQLLADAERDPGNGAWLDFQLAEYGRSLSARGLDATAPMMELGSAVQLRRGLAYVQRGDLGSASALLQGWKPGSAHPGDISARYESGAAGSSAIGYDKKGGTSYGRFQLSSRQGSMEGFLRFLESKGGEAAAIAARLRSAGPADTGGKSGAMPEAWKREAQTPGFADLEREYIQREFYEPAMRSLPSGAAAAVQASPQLQQMVWSTAVQHGAGGAADIFRKAWRDGMGNEDFVRAAYAERATRFGGSEPDVRASVQRRLRREADDILGGLSGGGGVNGMSLAAAAQLEGAIDRQRSRMAVELQGQIQDAEAALMAGEQNVPIPSTEAILAAFGPKAEEVMQKLDDARQYGQDVLMCSAMSAEQQAKLIADYKPVPGEGYAAQAKRYEKLKEIIESDSKARQADAPAYLVRYDADVRQRYQSMLESDFSPESVQAYAASLEVARQSRGMPSPRDAAFLPADAASKMAETLMDSQQPAQVLTSLSTRFGRLWPAVERQIVTSGKLPDAISLVAAGMEPRSGALLIEATRDKEFLKKARERLAYTDNDVKEFRSDIREELEPLLKTLDAQGALQLSDSIVKNGTILALQYMLRSGYERNEAIYLAAKEIGANRYSFLGTYRVPKGYDHEAVASGLSFALQSKEMKKQVSKAVLQNVSGQTGVSQERVNEMFLESLQRGVTPVTLPDESGVALYLRDRPVMGKDGRPVRFTWEELLDFARQAKEIEDSEKAQKPFNRIAAGEWW